MQNEDYTELENLNLINPDSREESFFDFPERVQQRILGSMLCDDFFLIQCLVLVKPQYFRDKCHRFICQKIFDFHDHNESKQITKDILECEINNHFKQDTQRYCYLAELDIVCDSYEPGIVEQEYFLNQITEFAKRRSLQIAVDKTIGILQSKNAEDRWSLVKDVMSEALSLERPTDNLGTVYFESVESRYQRMLNAEANTEKFSSGFKSIDEALSGGLCRKEIGAFAGMSGAGKSLALVTAAKANLIHGKNVLYVSLEMDEDKIADRFDSMLCGVPTYVLKTDHNTVIQTINDMSETAGTLYIKQFPAGMADVVTLRAYYAQLRLKGFSPDLVIVDYVGEFKDIPGLKTYESRQRLVRDLRGFAVEKNFCCLTAMQINRAGRDAMKEQGYIDDDLLADSAGQVRPLDALWTISQTEGESKCDLGVIFTSKHRSGRGRFKVFFQRTPSLEMVEISPEIYRLEMSKAQKRNIEGVETEILANMQYDGFANNSSNPKSIIEKDKQRGQQNES